MALNARAAAALRLAGLRVPHTTALDARAVLVYDGVCNICNAGVHWLAVRDPTARIAYCSLQADAAAPLLAATGLTRQSLHQRFALIEGSAAAVMLAGLDTFEGPRISRMRPAWLAAAPGPGLSSQNGGHAQTKGNAKVILAKRGSFQVHRASNAALRAAELASVGIRGGPSWLLWAAAAGRLVPVSIRDAIYDTIAESRYSVFGRTDACQLPPPGLTERFLDVPRL